MQGFMESKSAGLVALGLLALLGTGAKGQTDYVPHRLLVTFQPRVSRSAIRSFVASSGSRDRGVIPNTGIHVLELPVTLNEPAAAHAFGRRSEVAFAVPDFICTPAATPNDPYYGSEWHLAKIGAPSAWNTTTGSSSVIIAILDTGCDATHPDLAPKYVPGWNFYDNNSDTRDVNGHGTPVAGTAAACSNNGSGVASLAWGCKIMPIRISDASGNASSSAMANGLTWAADHGARVANISYTNVGWLTAVRSAAQYFQSMGGVITTSAGNNSASLTYADNPYLLTVSATDANDALTSWSNTGTPIDLAAPGNGIYTTSSGGGYAAWAGTSFSAPVVAGVAALVLSANPSLTGEQARSILEQSADDLGAPGWDPSYGYGRVNAAKAVSLAMNSGTTANAAPTVATAASAAANPVAGTSVDLSVLGTDDGGEANLTYTWGASGPSGVSFTANGSNAAKITTANFSASGSYLLTVSLCDSGGLSTTSTVSVTVNQTAITLSVSPTLASLTANTTLQFSAITRDQFGVSLTSQPVCAWSVSGGGTISGGGLLTAGSMVGGPYTVSASAGGQAGTATFNVTAAPDTTAPIVSITSPTGGKVSGTFAVAASASDNVGVASVKLWVDGKLAGTDTSNPWTFSVSTNKWKSGSSHTLVCTAYDAAGNIGTSATATVTK